MKIPSTSLLWFLSILRRHLHQYAWRAPVTFTKSNNDRLNHCFMWPQTSLVNERSLHRCTGLSKLFMQSLQSVSSVQPLLKRLFAVRIFYKHCQIQ
jgi:hypothetical protein